MTYVARPYPAVVTKRLFADAALALTFLCVVSLFTMSSSLLENVGYHYFVPGGFPWEKVHPATFLAIGALALRFLAARRPVRAFVRTMVGEPALILFLLSIAIAAGHAVLVSRTPVTQLIDTFVLPVALVLLLRDLDPAIRTKLAVLICALMGVNALIGFAEYPTGWRLVTTYIAEINPMGYTSESGGPITAAQFDWRATALLGHPLINALATGALALCLASPGARWLAPAIRFPLIALMMVAEVAFGGRVSMVLAVAGLAIVGAIGMVSLIASGRGVSRKALSIVMFVIPLIAMAIYVGFEIGAFDRLIDRFQNDAGSANARVLMWDMFDKLSWADIAIGPDADVVRLQQYLLGLELGIESFWVAITLTYGLIVSLILFCGLGLFSMRLYLTQAAGTATVLIYFFLVGSTSTSLASKSTSFALIVVMILTILQPRTDDAYLSKDHAA